VQISLHSPHVLAVSYTAEDEQGELQKVILPEGFRPGANGLVLPFQNIVRSQLRMTRRIGVSRWTPSALPRGVVRF
jgi:hypothetical protein